MKSIERRFRAICAEHPNISSYTCFARAVKGQNFTRRSVSEWFTRLVDKEDYDAADKNTLVRQLHTLSQSKIKNDSTTDSEAKTNKQDSKDAEWTEAHDLALRQTDAKINSESAVVEGISRKPGLRRTLPRSLAGTGTI